MKTTSVVLLGASMAAAAMGCGSSGNNPFGADPDFASVQSKLSTPTGTLAAGRESSVIAAYQQQSAQQAGGFAYGDTSSGGASPVATKALHVLGDPGKNWCPALAAGDTAGSCACPNGGALRYDFQGVQQLKQQQHGPIDVTLRIHADACNVDGGSVNGNEFIKLKSTSQTPNAKDFFMLLDVHFSFSKPPVTGRIDLDASFLDGKWWYAVDAGDGTLIVGSDIAQWNDATKTGTLYVHARDASWTCKLTGGKGTCTSDKGETRTVS